MRHNSLEESEETQERKNVYKLPKRRKRPKKRRSSEEEDTESWGSIKYNIHSSNSWVSFFFCFQNCSSKMIFFFSEGDRRDNQRRGGGGGGGSGNSGGDGGGAGDSEKRNEAVRRTYAADSKNRSNSKGTLSGQHVDMVHDLLYVTFFFADSTLHCQNQSHRYHN